MLTFDSNHFVNDAMDARGVNLGGRFQYRDSQGRIQFVDSTGAFLVGELERLDQTMHEPLASVSWSRDIDLREDVTLADEVTSFTLSNFGSAGNLGTGSGIGTGKAWIGKDTDQITGLSLDLAKIPHPLRLWGMELKYTIPELASAAKLGRPVDAQKYEGLQLKHQMDIDEQIYIGDITTGDAGMLTQATGAPTAGLVYQSLLPVGSAGSTLWANKNPDEILADFNLMLETTWTNAGWAVIPSRVLLPPAQFGQISTQKVSQAGNVSVLKYIQDNNLLTTAGRGKLDILPCKWNIGAGSGGTIGTLGTVDRAMVYTKDKQRLRYPMTVLQRTPVQYDSIYHKTTYFCRLGVVEVVYPETMSYWDGL